MIIFFSFEDSITQELGLQVWGFFVAFILDPRMKVSFFVCSWRAECKLHLFFATVLVQVKFSMILVWSDLVVFGYGWRLIIRYAYPDLSVLKCLKRIKICAFFLWQQWLSGAYVVKLFDSFSIMCKTI